MPIRTSSNIIIIVGCVVLVLQLPLLDLDNGIFKEIVPFSGIIISHISDILFAKYTAILKKSNQKYANIDSELYGRILITLLEGTMLKIKIEKAERPKEDFLAFFDKLFTILNEPN